MCLHQNYTGDVIFTAQVSPLKTFCDHVKITVGWWSRPWSSGSDRESQRRSFTSSPNNSNYATIVLNVVLDVSGTTWEAFELPEEGEDKLSGACWPWTVDGSESEVKCGHPVGNGLFLSSLAVRQRPWRESIWTQWQPCQKGYNQTASNAF